MENQIKALNEINKIQLQTIDEAESLLLRTKYLFLKNLDVLQNNLALFNDINHWLDYIEQIK